MLYFFDRGIKLYPLYEYLWAPANKTCERSSTGNRKYLFIHWLSNTICGNSRLSEPCYDCVNTGLRRRKEIDNLIRSHMVTILGRRRIGTYNSISIWIKRVQGIGRCENPRPFCDCPVYPASFAYISNSLFSPAAKLICLRPILIGNFTVRGIFSFLVHCCTEVERCRSWRIWVLGISLLAILRAVFWETGPAMASAMNTAIAAIKPVFCSIFNYSFGFNIEE